MLPILQATFTWAKLKIMAGLNAAFVDVGAGKDGFLHYLDLGHNYLQLQNFVSKCISGNIDGAVGTKKQFPELPKNGLISDVLKQGQLALVQITKEPISTKGPRLSGEISLQEDMLYLSLLEKRFLFHKR